MNITPWKALLLWSNHHASLACFQDKKHTWVLTPYIKLSQAFLEIMSILYNTSLDPTEVSKVISFWLSRTSFISAEGRNKAELIASLFALLFDDGYYPLILPWQRQLTLMTDDQRKCLLLANLYRGMPIYLSKTVSINRIITKKKVQGWSCIHFTWFNIWKTIAKYCCWLVAPGSSVWSWAQVTLCKWVHMMSCDKLASHTGCRPYLPRVCKVPHTHTFI